jgi:hypothetical protein
LQRSIHSNNDDNSINCSRVYIFILLTGYIIKRIHRLFYLVFVCSQNDLHSILQTYHIGFIQIHSCNSGAFIVCIKLLVCANNCLVYGHTWRVSNVVVCELFSCRA